MLEVSREGEQEREWGDFHVQDAEDYRLTNSGVKTESGTQRNTPKIPRSTAKRIRGSAAPVLGITFVRRFIFALPFHFTASDVNAKNGFETVFCGCEKMFSITTKRPPESSEDYEEPSKSSTQWIGTRSAVCSVSVRVNTWGCIEKCLKLACQSKKKTMIIRILQSIIIRPFMELSIRHRHLGTGVLMNLYALGVCRRKHTDFATICKSWLHNFNHPLRPL